MEKLLWWLIPIAVVFVSGLIFKKKRDAWLKVICLLIEAVEIIDKEIKDFLPDDMANKLIKIKKYIKKKIGKECVIIDKLKPEIEARISGKKNP